MEVFKFGGASVKDASGVRNIAKIINLHNEKPLVIVVSAMGKTTNALEQLTEAYVNESENAFELLEEVKSFHQAILDDLFPEKHPIHDQIANTFVEIDWILEDDPLDDYDFNYDQIVSIGELVSSKIVSEYLKTVGLTNKWIDARSFIHTDNTYREGQVNWGKTRELIKPAIPSLLKSQHVVTQGFIGGTSENFTTTLGREGSDYSAAIFAACLSAEKVTIWKDVPGVLNADPKFFSETYKYDALPYPEALEMAFYGATIIHPKTIKPLQNENIPLYVRPFLSLNETGTLINNSDVKIEKPAIILKQNQVLISISALDFSFITENHLGSIFKAFADTSIKVNAMQVSALTFSACFDWDERKFYRLSEILRTGFSMKYNNHLQLITIRHYQRDQLSELLGNKTILLEQLSRNTAQFVVKIEQ